MYQGRPLRNLGVMSTAPSLALPAAARGAPMRARSQLLIFLAAYLVYTAGRWLTNADLGPATEHADGS